MAPVVGIGGFFFRSADPSALTEWYREAFGLTFEGGATIFAAAEEPSYAVLAVFGPDDGYIGAPARQSAMVNLRVSDLDGVLDHLRTVGAKVEPITDEIYGRFSWTYDCDGNRVELWEPKPVDQDPTN